MCEAALTCKESCKDKGHPPMYLQGSAGVYQVFTQQLVTVATSGQLPTPWKALVCCPLILFWTRSKAGPCSWGLFPHNGLLGKAPVSAAWCLGSFN